jgi:uncharacterized phage protein gp47/JayE
VTNYSRPAYSALLARIASDLAALPSALREPLAAMWAQVGNGMHGHLEWIDKQCSPLTCELERLYDWAGLYGVSRLSATAATGMVLATGNVGAQVLAGTLLRGTNGLDYAVISTVALGSGNTPVAVRCTAAGSSSNLPTGAVLSLIDALAGVTGSLTVDSLGGGSDEEVEAVWRARVASEWQAVVTQGGRSGKPDDYRFWAMSAHPSVTGSIVQPHALGIGTVVVRPICNSLVNRLPSQAVLDAVSAFYAAVAPATADWRVTVPSVSPVTLSIHLLPAYDTTQNRNAITAALSALVMSKGGDGVLTLPWAEVDIAIATVTTQYTIDEVGTISWLASEVPVLQPINWV